MFVSKRLGQWLVKLKGAGQAASSSREQFLVSGVQRVINAPKEALLMKKIRGRVAYIVWDVYPTQR